MGSPVCFSIISFSLSTPPTRSRMADNVLLSWPGLKSPPAVISPQPQPHCFCFRFLGIMYLQFDIPAVYTQGHPGTTPKVPVGGKNAGWKETFRVRGAAPNDETNLPTPRSQRTQRSTATLSACFLVMIKSASSFATAGTSHPS